MARAKTRKRPGSKVKANLGSGITPISGRLYQKRNLSPEQAQKTLSDNVIIIEKDDAGKVLELMYQLAKLIVNQNFTK